MKKIISVISITMVIISCLSLTCLAKSETDESISLISNDQVLSEVYGLYDINDAVNVMSTGLIIAKKLTLSKTSNQLVINAVTTGSGEVTKCGFTYIKLQRLVDGKWTDYTAYCYTDQYSDSTSKIFSKSITPPKGYTYRVICEHYAEKKKLLILKSKETSYNVTSSLAF